MFNSHLLQKGLTVDEFEEVMRNYNRNEALLDRLPAYTIARCPFCQEANIERVNTYTVESHSLGNSATSPSVVLRHCRHFSFVHSFYHFNSLTPTDVPGIWFRPEVPFVLGFLATKRRKCRAVIHALPVCQLENNDFVPRFTMFLMTYFSSQPEATYHEMVVWASTGPGADGYLNYFRLPDEEDWWDLRRRVAEGSLYWVNANDPELGILTREVDGFPYGNITGRKTYMQV